MVHLGLDIGYGQTKLAWSSNYAQPVAEVHPSGAAPIERCDRMAGGQVGDTALGYGEEVIVGNRRFGSLIDPDRIQNGMQVLHQDYAGTPEYMALYYGALARVGSNVIDHLVTGLPVAQCKDKERARYVKSLLLGRHNVREGFSVSVNQVTIVPQAVGAYYAFQDRRIAAQPQHDTLLVVDFGHFSVDWVLISGRSFRDSSSNSCAQGGSYVIDRMVSLIKAKHGIAVGRERIYGYVREGLKAVHLGTEEVDLHAIGHAAAAEVAPTVVGQIRASLRDQSTDVNRVLLCGGSTPFFEAAMRDAFPKAVYELAPMPVLANAIGFRLFAKKSG
ncbi:ParM/StbA family protein [Rhodanobacter denitrificans]|uniref:Uncharacterized protein n=1 Tax=Rhodanobacter denitrificans TaxID=666685 RepID=M4NG90_9GAMM|nr:ParM/StbA family protein [Rhodanobacter denitrificans]AGG89097.1 hypothetical protein R2APBS1_1974 [Rhodanobacter denitrificans]UJJ52922.1 ParM/StbA family protein [Rhodanobacter denitrificans]